LDEKILKYCKENKLAKEKEFWQENYKRCYWILKGIYRFETWNLKSYVWNNIFNFRSPTIKKEWKEKFWVIEIRWWFLVFVNKTSSIRFAVNHFYKYNYRKSVKQIISWWSYYNLKWQFVSFKWFTHTGTQEEHNNYIAFIKKHLLTN
jgi:hypothetical protein